jgi:hypothetical protein
MARDRGAFLDQSQSLNLYMAGASSVQCPPLFPALSHNPPPPTFTLQRHPPPPTPSFCAACV